MLHVQTLRWRNECAFRRTAQFGLLEQRREIELTAGVRDAVQNSHVEHVHQRVEAVHGAIVRVDNEGESRETKEQQHQTVDVAKRLVCSGRVVIIQVSDHEIESIFTKRNKHELLKVVCRGHAPVE